jgi:hypothetical protein
MVANFSRLSVPGSGKHLLENGTILLLISHSLHLWSGRVEKVHSWINHTLQLGAIGKLRSGLITCSFLPILWLWLPWSCEPDTKRLAHERIMAAMMYFGSSAIGAGVS